MNFNSLPKNATHFLFPPMIMATELEATVGNFKTKRKKDATNLLLYDPHMSPQPSLSLYAEALHMASIFLMHLCTYAHIANLKKKTVATVEDLEPSCCGTLVGQAIIQ